MRRRGSGDKGEWSARLSSRSMQSEGCCWILPCRRGARDAVEVTEEVGAFCPPCWSKIEWLGNSGCKQCGLPLAGTEIDNCGRCLAQPPLLDRIRAAVAYDDLPRSIALKLKYGRKVALARTMARYMVPLKGRLAGEPSSFRCRCTAGGFGEGGFNQSALVAREVARRWGLHASVRPPGQVNSAAQGPQSN